MNRYQKVRGHFKKVDPVIHSVMQDLDFDNWLKQSKERTTGLDYFRALCREIIGQQLSGKVANTINRRFQELFDEKVTPDKLINTDDVILREIGISWAKASYVKNIAKAYLDKSVLFNELNQMENEKVIEELSSIKGIGPWTAEMFLIFTLGREDVFSFGDLGLKKGFSKLYEIENPSDDEIEKVTLKWKPYRTYGSITLWHALDSEVVEINKKIRK